MIYYKIYYKIVHGFGPEDYIEIDETEIQKAFYAFLEKKDAVFSGGAIKGSMIQSIKPDYHRTMGWNRGYKLASEDFEQLSHSGIESKVRDFLGASKAVVHSLIQSGQTHLIGKSAIPALPSKRIGGMAHISELSTG